MMLTMMILMILVLVVEIMMMIRVDYICCEWHAATNATEW